MSQIINAHVHLIELEALARMGEGPIIPGDIAVYENLDDSVSMFSPATLLAQMDEAGIEKSVLFAVNAPIVYSSNEYVKELCDAYPDRFIGFASLNPLAPDASEVLAHAVTALGLKGLKFHPPLQRFRPNDEAVFGVYEKAASLDIPVVFHVGSTPFGNRCPLAYASPLLIDDVASSFPDLRIMLTHLGTLWHHEAFMVVEKHPNVFIDTAAYLYEIPELLNLNLIKRLGKDKVIFGTDYPSPFGDEHHRMKDFVSCVRGLGLPEEVERAIFHDNFHTLLHGRKKPRAGVEATALLGKLNARKRDA